MNYYIGIDGGGTNTVGRISNGETVLKEAVVGGTNCHAAPYETIKESMNSLITELSDAVGIHMNELSGICLGGAGIDTKRDQELMGRIFREIGYTGKLIIHNDAVTALVGANLGYEGALLISGTGSIAFAVKRDQTQHRVGGWGHLIGDEGSGYSIGRNGFISIAKALDQRGPETALWELYKGIYPFESGEDIIDYIYMQNRGKDEIAKFAQVVIDAYEKDHVAKSIVDQAIDELAETIEAINHIMDRSPFKLSVAGSVLTKSERMYELLNSKIQKQFKNIEFHRPLQDPVYGAILLAMNESGNVN